MMQSRSREKAMLATVSRLRRLLRNADLATKLVRVMRDKKILHRAKLAGGEPGRDVRRFINDYGGVGYDPVPARIKRRFCAVRGAGSCPMASAGRHPRSEFREAACGGPGGPRRSRAVLCPARQRAQSPRGGRQTRREFLQRRGQD